jgi:hypothetical protein
MAEPKTQAKPRMVSSIREVLAITKSEDLKAALLAFDEQMSAHIKPLLEALDKNIISLDVPSIQAHMGMVEAWRGKLVRMLALAAAAVEHSKGIYFVPSKVSGDGESRVRLTEDERKAYTREQAAGWVAWQVKLEGLIACIDSRTNLAKKLLGIDFEGEKRRA